MKKTTLITGFIIALFSAKAQDTIWLKSGKTISGQIVSFVGGKVNMQVGKETSVYTLEEIKSLRYNGPSGKATDAAPAYTEDKKRKKEIAPKPVKTEQ